MNWILVFQAVLNLFIKNPPRLHPSLLDFLPNSNPSIWNLEILKQKKEFFTCKWSKNVMNITSKKTILGQSNIIRRFSAIPNFSCDQLSSRKSLTFLILLMKKFLPNQNHFNKLWKLFTSSQHRDMEECKKEASQKNRAQQKRSARPWPSPFRLTDFAAGVGTWRVQTWHQVIRLPLLLKLRDIRRESAWQWGSLIGRPHRPRPANPWNRFIPHKAGTHHVVDIRFQRSLCLTLASIC